METIEKDKVKNSNVFILTESYNDQKKPKRVAAYTTFEGLRIEENFNGPGGSVILSRYKFNKQVEDKGAFTYSDFNRHIEIRKVSLITTQRANK